ncbi:MAG: hypothetical protein LV480_13490 [Methylacidiphilales bacterium]|nr:hypothetical protein [Candidatus Methylacidiphilales bacterium]
MPSHKTSKLRLLVTVKAYPSPSTKYEETVCCAGIAEDKSWLRLYPVPYRDLPGQRQFQKYDLVEVVAERREPHKDDRPESWRPRLDTMKIIGHIQPARNWRERLAWISPTVLSGYAELLRLQKSENKSLGAFRPTKILGVKVKPEKDRWSPAQIAAINQQNLFSDKEPLELVPYRFQIGFQDEEGKSHWLSVIDWEFSQLWRKERDRLGDAQKAADQVYKKLEEVTSAQRDLILFAGNQANPARRQSFMILGCCWPKIDLQESLNL